ncbi:MAG: hypothetical protein K2H09_04445, partial [Treponemataceae bacterium]|nr:hypothetical protein [Treponemataceae bacterium]
ESLRLQMELTGNAPPLARFFLDGHLELLLPQDPEKIRRKLLDWLGAQKQLSFKNQQEENPPFSKNDISEAAIVEAVQFIHSLNPFPAAEFSAGGGAHYIRPDIYVVRCSGELEQELPEKGLILDGASSYFRISLANDVLPVVRVSTDFQNSGISEKITSTDGRKFMRAKLKDARTFIETLGFRGEIILRSCSLLVRSQKDFFRSGPGHLRPMSQRQFARGIGVHESTVSRMADSKFLHCDWGTFPIKYFFTTSIARPPATGRAAAGGADAAGGTPAPEQRRNMAQDGMDFGTLDGAAAVSSDTIRHIILEILKNQPPAAKRLSDQKLSDELAARGYSVARRTVAKYRAQLNIESSYRR